MDALADFLVKLKRWVIYDAERQFYYKHFPSLVENASLVLRPMTWEDLQQVARIEAESYEFPWEFETFKSCFKIGYHCWVGERASEVVCYGISTIAAQESHVLNVCVSPKYQGKGYGRMVLMRLIDVAAKFRTESMFLEVRPSNPKAIKLYRSLGFNEIGSRPGYYPAKNGREDAIVMARSFMYD